jgi:hypothetical protein
VMAAVARQTKETGLTGEESYLRLLKSPVRTGRLLSMWLQSTEYVRQGQNRVRKPNGQRKRRLEQCSVAEATRSNSVCRDGDKHDDKHDNKHDDKVSDWKLAKRVAYRCSLQVDRCTFLIRRSWSESHSEWHSEWHSERRSERRSESWSVGV